MAIFLKISMIVIAVVTFIAITKVKIKITYKHERDNDLFMIRLYAWKLKLYTISTPLIEVDKDSPSIVLNKQDRSTFGKNKEKVRVTPQTIRHYFKNMQNLIAHIVHLKKIVIRFLRRVHLEQLEWKSVIGTSDAALTGKIIGVIWGLKGTVVGVLGYYLQMKQMPKLDVQADFQKRQSKTSMSCMISFRLGHAIIAVIMALKHWKRKPMMHGTSEQVTS